MEIDKKVIQAQRESNKHTLAFMKFCILFGEVAKNLSKSIDKMTRNETCTQKQYDTTAYWLHQAQELLPIQMALEDECKRQSKIISRINNKLRDTLPKIERDLKDYKIKPD